MCGRENCQKKNDSRICPDCNKEVRSESCYIAHKLEKKRKGTNIMLPSLCEQNWQCKECGISLKRNEKNTMNVVRSHIIIVVTTTCQMNNIYAT